MIGNRLRSLSKPVVNRLRFLWRTYSQTPLESLPAPVRAEVKQILGDALGNTPAVISRPPAPRQILTRPALSQRPAPNGHTNGTRPPPRLPDENAITILGTDSQTSEAITLSLEERFQGLYVIGATGTGKTTLLENMVLSDIRGNLGLCLIEPHGDLTKNVIAAMPKERLNDVIYLDITDPTSSFGLNLFACPVGADDTEAAKIAGFVMHLFETIWSVGPETPRLAQVLRNTTRLLIENPGMTFAEIPLLLWDDGVREKLVRRVTNTQTKLFWSQYNKRTPRDRDELIASTINKCDAYLNEPLVSRIVSQAVSTIDFRRIMDEGKILLIRLSPQLEEASRLIGAAILRRLLMASFSRSDTPQAQRRPFMIYADEYQRFATQDFAVFLAEARKARVSTTIANQVLEQLSDLNRATALQAGTVVVMRVSGEDSKVLGSTFNTTPQPALVGEEPIRAPAADPISHLTRHSHPNPLVAKFVADYLLPLEALLRRGSSSMHGFVLGCAMVLSHHVVEGHKQLNECFSSCMREGNADVTIPPLALFILAGGAAPDSTNVFFKDLHRRLGIMHFQGFNGTSEYFGKPDFVSKEREQKAVAFLRKMAKTSIFDSRATVENRVAAFTRMLKSLRATLAILAKEPLLTDTGLFQPKYQLRSYADQENLVANELSQLPNYTAKVKLLTGEHTIRTSPPPPLVSEREVEERIRAIKERMLNLGYTKSAAAVEEEVRKRHEALRARPDDDGPPPIHSNGRRSPRQKPTPRT
jgi:hypothetical protein